MKAFHLFREHRKIDFKISFIVSVINESQPISSHKLSKPP